MPGRATPDAPLPFAGFAALAALATLAAFILLGVLGTGCATLPGDPEQYERRARAAEAIHAAAESEDQAQAPARTPLDPVNDDAAWLALTADDDLRIAAAVRERILAAGDVSFDAKNVTIIADGGAVVLKGRVGSAAEERRVVALAREVAGVHTVEDQLEVSP